MGIYLSGLSRYRDLSPKSVPNCQLDLRCSSVLLCKLSAMSRRLNLYRHIFFLYKRCVTSYNCRLHNKTSCFTVIKYILRCCKNNIQFPSTEISKFHPVLLKPTLCYCCMLLLYNIWKSTQLSSGVLVDIVGWLMIYDLGLVDPIDNDWCLFYNGMGE